MPFPNLSKVTECTSFKYISPPKEEAKEDEERTAKRGCWASVPTESDNDRYRRFLEYCEDKRATRKSRQEEDEKRMKEQRKKEEHWEMLRECRRIIKERCGMKGEQRR